MSDMTRLGGTDAGNGEQLLEFGFAAFWASFGLLAVPHEFFELAATGLTFVFEDWHGSIPLPARSRCVECKPAQALRKAGKQNVTDTGRRGRRNVCYGRPMRWPSSS